MKRSLGSIVILFALFLTLLTACRDNSASSMGNHAGDQASNQPGNQAGSQTADEPVQENTGSVALVTDPYGGLYRSGFGTANGFYDQFAVTGGSTNIIYTDYASAQRVYLCNQPNCAHNDDTCTSWFKIFGDAVVFADNNSGKVFLLSSGYADEPLGDEDVQGKIYAMNADGSDRKVLYRLGGKESFTDAAAMDNTYIYATVQYADEAAGGLKKEIRRINMTNGDASAVCQLENYSDRIFGAFGTSLVIQTTDESNRRYYCADVHSGNKSDVLYEYNYLDGVRTEAVNGATLYSIREAAAPLYSVYSVDLQSGEEKEIVPSLEVYNVDTLHIDSFFDNRMLIGMADNRDVQNIRFLLYNVNLNANSLNTCELNFAFFQDTRNVTILSEYADSFLVEMGVEQGQVTLVGNDGLPYTVEATIPQYALISKSDFWSNVPNYAPIQDAIAQ